MIITIFILNPTKVSFLGIRPRYFSKSSLRFLQQPECIRTFSNMSDIVVRKDINNLAIRNLTSGLRYVQSIWNVQNVQKFCYRNFSINQSRAYGTAKSQSKLTSFNKRLINLNSIYNSSSPIFKQLLVTLTNSPLNETTQLKIEKFLQNQALELNESNLVSGKSELGYAKTSNEIILLFLKSKESLEKLILNYKTNLILEDAELSDLLTRIIYNLDINFIINILYGRVLVIISNREQISNKNIMIDVAISLGKEIIKKYLFDLYNTQTEAIERNKNSNNTKITLLMWKNNNKSLIELTENTQFIFKLGNILIN